MVHAWLHMHFMSIKSILQVLTFLRGDSKYKFAIHSEASYSYSVHLRVLNYTIITCLQLLPCVVVSGAHRTFLKEGSTLPYFPSGRTDRGKDAPHSVYVRALHIKKSLLDDKDRQFLDQSYRVFLIIIIITGCEQMKPTIQPGSSKGKSELLF